MPEAIKYRVMWCELLGGQVVPFSGRICTFEQAATEADSRRSAYNYHGVFIEARRASESPWPSPWDDLEAMRERMEKRGPNGIR